MLGAVMTAGAGFALWATQAPDKTRAWQREARGLTMSAAAWGAYSLTTIWLFPHASVQWTVAMGFVSVAVLRGQEVRREARRKMRDHA